uniref:Uncharacterized protein n=1 Tax=Anguilla anguilla TaxID=7936 RepID=A0A0E9QDA4_ANGAN
MLSGMYENAVQSQLTSIWIKITRGKDLKPCFHRRNFTPELGNF